MEKVRQIATALLATVITPDAGTAAVPKKEPSELNRRGSKELIGPQDPMRGIIMQEQLEEAEKMEREFGNEPKAREVVSEYFKNLSLHHDMQKRAYERKELGNLSITEFDKSSEAANVVGNIARAFGLIKRAEPPTANEKSYIQRYDPMTLKLMNDVNVLFKNLRERTNDQQELMDSAYILWLTRPMGEQ